MLFIDKYVMVYAYVPEHFLSCKELSYMDKLVYIRIVGFCRNGEYNHTCFASNGYFANLFGVKPKAISVAIGKLKRLGYINVNYVKKDNIRERHIILTSNVWCEISKDDSLTKEEVITCKKDYNNKDNNKKIVNNKGPVISYDTDGVMLWNGKRCESLPLTEEEQQEMNELLKDFE